MTESREDALAAIDEMAAHGAVVVEEQIDRCAAKSPSSSLARADGS